MTWMTGRMRMTWMTSLRRRRAGLTLATVSLLTLSAGALAGCGALDVSDPTAIEEDELGDPAGAQLLRGGVIRRWQRALAQGAKAGGLMSDEYFADPALWYEEYGYPSPDNMFDRRLAGEILSVYDGQWANEVYRPWQEVRYSASEVIPRLRAHADAAGRDALIGEMFELRGHATLQLAEDFCAGFPLHDVVNDVPVYGPAMSTDEVLESALADFDLALVYAVDSARVLDFARIGRGRTLLALGRFDEAGLAVAAVPTQYKQIAEYSENGSNLHNTMSIDEFGSWERSVADNEGGIGIDFVSSGDSRVGAFPLGAGTDGVTMLYETSKYPHGYPSPDPITAASGIEARLIEAEAAVAANNGNWLTILNDLRANWIVPALPALTDPGTPDARLDLVFRERAFWLFGTGHRLGDLRRLIHRHGRAYETVFPNGAYWRGGSYEDAQSIPFPVAVEHAFSPTVTGCTGP